MNFEARDRTDLARNKLATARKALRAHGYEFEFESNARGGGEKRNLSDSSVDELTDMLNELNDKQRAYILANLELAKRSKEKHKEMERMCNSFKHQRQRIERALENAKNPPLNDVSKFEAMLKDLESK